MNMIFISTYRYTYISYFVKVGWYWGPLSWIDAERLLKDKQDYSFIVRDSSHRHYFLAITFKSQGNIHHTRIEHSNSSFSFYHGNSKSQCTSSDVVEFIENTIEHSKSGQFMFFIRSNIPGKHRFKEKIFYEENNFKSRSTNDACSSSVSCLTFCIYVLAETYRPVCYSSSNSSRSYR